MSKIEYPPQKTHPLDIICNKFFQKDTESKSFTDNQTNRKKKKKKKRNEKKKKNPFNMRLQPCSDPAHLISASLS